MLQVTPEPGRHKFLECADVHPRRRSGPRKSAAFPEILEENESDHVPEVNMPSQRRLRNCQVRLDEAQWEVEDESHNDAWALSLLALILRRADQRFMTCAGCPLYSRGVSNSAPDVAETFP